MKSVLSFCIVLIFIIPSFAATPKDVTFKSDGDTVKAIAYTPEGKGPFPAIIVIHAWWGLNDWVKEQASKLADQGHLPLAVAPYRGKVATARDEASELSHAPAD